MSQLHVKKSNEGTFNNIDGILILLAAIPFLLLVFHFNFLADDSFISFRYARNLADGYGLRYNVSENPPVEGFSSPLWVVILALFMKIGVKPMLSSRVISIACGLLLLAMVYWSCRRTLRLDYLRSFIGALCLGLFPPISVWSTSGMEILPFALCFFALLMVFLKTEDKIRLPLAVFLGITLMLLRPEGMGYAFAIPFLVGAYFYWVKKPGFWRKGLIIYFILVGVGLLLLTTFRLIYFGYPLPNTFYAKVGARSYQLIRGSIYVAHFFITFIGAGVILLGSLISILSSKRRSELLPFVAVFFMLVVVNIALGGDYMCMGRFFVPSAAILSILLAGALCPGWEELKVAPRVLLHWGEYRKVLAIPLFVATLGVLVLNLLPSFDINPAPFSWRKVVNFRHGPLAYFSEEKAWEEENHRRKLWTLCGKALDRVTSPGSSVVLGTIGAIGYYSNLEVYDKFGLVNLDVAHSVPSRRRASAGHEKKVPVYYFLKYRPDLISPRLVFMGHPQVALKTYRDRISEFPDSERKNYSVFQLPVPVSFEGKRMMLVGMKRVDYTFSD